MEQLYTVVIHYAGTVDFEIEADNEEKAKQIAEAHFDNMSDMEIVANLGDIGICDCYEVE